MANLIDHGRRVEWALTSLTPADREDVVNAVDRLRDWPDVAASPQVHVVAGPAGEGRLYVLRAGDELRVLFTIGDDGAIIIRDIANRELLSRYFRPAAG